MQPGTDLLNSKLTWERHFKTAPMWVESSAIDQQMTHKLKTTAGSFT